MNNVITKIAASTVAAHEAAGEPSPITLPQAKIQVETTSNSGLEKTLESVLDALPEPKAPGQGRRKPRRATSGGTVAPASSSATSEIAG
jgi:ribonuclease E